MASFTSLAPELHIVIGEYLAPSDILNLQKVSQRFQSIYNTHEDHIAASIISRRYPFVSTELPLPQKKATVSVDVHASFQETFDSGEYYRIENPDKASVSRFEAVSYPAAYHYPSRHCHCSACFRAWATLFATARNIFAGKHRRNIAIVMQAVGRRRIAYAYVLERYLGHLREQIDMPFHPLSLRVLTGGSEFQHKISNARKNVEPQSDGWLMRFMEVKEPMLDRLHRRACVGGKDKDVAPNLKPFDDFRYRVHKGMSFVDDPLADPVLGHDVLVYMTEMKLRLQKKKKIVGLERSLQARFSEQMKEGGFAMRWSRRLAMRKKVRSAKPLEIRFCKHSEVPGVHSIRAAFYYLGELEGSYFLDVSTTPHKARIDSTGDVPEAKQGRCSNLFGSGRGS